MKKLMMLLSLLVIALFVVSCAPKEGAEAVAGQAIKVGASTYYNCTDSDGGVNYYAPGYHYYTFGNPATGIKSIATPDSTYKDTKTGTLKLLEKVCEGEVAKSDKKANCTELVKTTLKVSQTGKSIIAWACKCTSDNQCGAGGACGSDGVCKGATWAKESNPTEVKVVPSEPQIKCFDSDGGDNLTITGTVISTEYPTGITDYCQPNGDYGNNTLFEQLCMGGSYAFAKENCGVLGAGYSCKDGACVVGVSTDVSSIEKPSSSSSSSSSGGGSATNASVSIGSVTSIEVSTPTQGEINISATTTGLVDSIKFEANCKLGYWTEIGTSSAPPYLIKYTGESCNELRVQGTPKYKGIQGTSLTVGPFNYSK